MTQDTLPFYTVIKSVTKAQSFALGINTLWERKYLKKHSISAKQSLCFVVNHAWIYPQVLILS